jgi:kumamolisin
LANSSHHSYRELPGSTRQPLPGARQVGPIDPDETVEVSLYLRDPAEGELHQHIQGQAPRLSREEYASRHSASPADIAKVTQFAREHNLTVVSVNATARLIVLSGTAAAMSAAFRTNLQRYEYGTGRIYRGRTGALQMPAELAQVVVSVLGLDDRPQARFRLRYYDPTARPQAVSASFDPPTVARLYNFPSNVNGQGQCIGIIELGGGYSTTDMTSYFQQLSIPLPQIISVPVDGANNQPTGDPNSADGEVELDIEVAGAIAPGARIAVYFAPNTDRGFVDAITTAIHDTTNRPSVISISWGSAEDQWTDQARSTMDQAFQAAASLGITICAAAGDNGSSDGESDGQVHVDFPASDPYVLGCGGTHLEASNNQITSEVVWNDGPGSATGGGVSEVFALPTWQQGVHVPPSANPDKYVGRGVPDVAGDADPATGYQVLVDGQNTVVGGTSAVAPLWSALIVLINQQLGQSAGYLNPVLYQNYPSLQQSNALRPITQGNNGAYSAGPGWNACAGLGVPNGINLASALSTLLHQQQQASQKSSS